MHCISLRLPNVCNQAIMQPEANAKMQTYTQFTVQMKLSRSTIFNSKIKYLFMFRALPSSISTIRANYGSMQSYNSHARCRMANIQCLRKTFGEWASKCMWISLILLTKILNMKRRCRQWCPINVYFSFRSCIRKEYGKWVLCCVIVCLHLNMSNLKHLARAINNGSYNWKTITNNIRYENKSFSSK